MLDLATRTRLRARASDLGEGGCYIDMLAPFSAGTSLLLNLASENHSVHGKAAVVYAHPGMGMGLVFTELSSNQKNRLRSWLDELGGQGPEEQEPSQANTLRVQEPVVANKLACLHEVLNELVSMLVHKHVLSESEVELLREKMSE